MYRFERAYSTAALIAVLFITSASAAGCAKAWVGLGFPRPGDVETYDAEGVDDTVAIDWDYLYIPHVRGESDADAFYGLGYAMASSRLFQMDLFRHLALGEVASFAKLKVRVKQMGKKEKIDFREIDTFMRIMDFSGMGERYVEALSEDRRELVEAFSEGVNAFVAQHEKELSAPYSLPLGMGRAFKPWRPEHSGAILSLMSFVLSKNIDEESMAIQALKDGVPIEKLLTLLSPEYVLDPADFADLAALAPSLKNVEFIDGFQMWQEYAQGELHISPDTSGSNNWVVAGSRSESGKPIFANDPHLGRMMPGYWWLAHVRGPGYNVAGGFIPGVPSLIIGHNGQTAWGATMVKGDNVDLAVETIDPRNLTYKRNGEWKPLEGMNFSIPSRKKRVFPKSAYSTDFGPIISKITPETSAAVSVRWGAWYSDTGLEAAFDLMQTRSVFEIEAAAKRMGLVTINLVCADTKGNIGWFVTGDYPVRKGWSGFLPVNAADPSKGWSDALLPFHQRAGGVNPPEGWFATANNRPVATPYAEMVSYSYASPHRFTRIATMIQKDDLHTVDDFRLMQADTVSDQPAKLLPHIIAAANGDPELQAFIEPMRQWNHSMAVSSRGALYYQVFISNFVELAIGDLSPSTQEAYLASVQFNQQPVEALPMDSNGLWASPAERDELVRQALRNAKIELEGRFPKDLSSKTWGDLHRLYLKHPLAGAPFIGKKYRMETLPYPGDSQTVNAGGYRPGRTYDLQYYSSLRFLIDMNNPGEARVSFPGGQSENANHPAYANLFDAWYEVQDYQLLFNEDDLNAASMSARWLLTPED